MAAKTLTFPLLKKALDMHVTSTGQTISEGEDLGEKRFLLSPGDIKCSVKDGRLICSSQSVFDQLIEILMFMDDEPQASQSEDKADAAMMSPAKPPKAQVGLVSQADRQKIAEIKASKSPDSALQQFHHEKSTMYSTEDGQAPTAAMVSREANKHGLCTEIKEFTVTDDLVRAHVRVTDPVTGQFKEDGVAFTRAAFVAKKTIDIVNKHIKKNPGLVADVDPVSMRPILSPDAQIYGVPAPLFVAKEVLKSWNFLGRFAVTTAERRCQDKLLNAEFREKEEIELEQQEMADVAEGSA